jgi:hypothetical protein
MNLVEELAHIASHPVALFKKGRARNRFHYPTEVKLPRDI